jgi:hypothetical protein
MRELLKRRRLRALGIVAVGLASAAALWLVFSAQMSAPATIEDEPPEDQPPGSGPSLDTLLTGEFKSLVLTDVAEGAAPLSRVDAERVVAEESPFDKVREAKLARVESGWYECPGGCNAWIFSMDVSEFTHHKYFVALVDADTGKYLTGIGACYNWAGSGCP